MSCEGTISFLLSKGQLDGRDLVTVTGNHFNHNHKISSNLFIIELCDGLLYLWTSWNTTRGDFIIHTYHISKCHGRRSIFCALCCRLIFIKSHSYSECMTHKRAWNYNVFFDISETFYNMTYSTQIHLVCLLKMHNSHITSWLDIINFLWLCVAEVNPHAKRFWWQGYLFPLKALNLNKINERTRNWDPTLIAEDRSRTKTLQT